MKMQKKYSSFVQAALKGSLVKCKELLATGLDVNYQLDKKQSAFEAACENGSPELVKLFIAAKADINSNNSNGGPLHIILKTNKNESSVDLLIAAKIDIEAEHNGDTALLLAVKNGQIGMVNRLLFPDCNINKPYGSVKLPILHLACMSDPVNFLIIKALIDQKADLNALAAHAQVSPLIMAIEKQDFGLVKYLIARKAEVNLTNKKNFNPLVTAMSKENLEILEYLLEKKADVNQKLKKDQTILHLAITVIPKRMEIIKLLLERQANIHLEDKNHLTPLDLAIKNNERTIVELFNQSSNFQKTPHILLDEKESKILADIEKTRQNFFKEAKKLQPEIEKLSKILQLQLLAEATTIKKELTELQHAEVLSRIIKVNTPQKISMGVERLHEEKLLILIRRIDELKSKARKKISEYSLDPVHIRHQIPSYQLIKEEAATLMTQYIGTSKQLSSIQRQFKGIALPPHIEKAQIALKTLELDILKNYASIQSFNQPSNISPESDHYILTLSKQLNAQILDYQQRFLLFNGYIERIIAKNNKLIDREVVQRPLEKKLPAKTHHEKDKPKLKEIKALPSLIKPLLPKRPNPPTSRFFTDNKITQYSERVNHTFKLQKQNIKKHIIAGKFLLEKLDSSIILLNLMSFNELNRLKYSLIQILLAIVINQSQITRRSELRNMRNTLHQMSLIHGDINLNSLGPCQLQQEIQELADGLAELIKLFRKDEISQEYYLPRYIALNFTSPILIKMASPRFDLRGVADQKFQLIVKESAAYHQYCWMQLTHLLLQPKTVFHQFIPGEIRLTMTFAILSQITEANIAGQTTIRVHNKDFFLSSSLKAIAGEWRHRGLSLEEASHRLEEQFTSVKAYN